MSIFTRVLKYLTKGAAYKTAVHELGHCAIIKHYGGTVNHVSVNPMGYGGYTYYDYLENDTKELQVLVGGYVAERLLKGRKPTFPIRGGCYEGDLKLIREMKATDDDVKLAISAAERIIGKPETFEYIKQIAHYLADAKHMSGSSIKL